MSIHLGDDLNKIVQIGSLLALEVKEWLITFLRANADVFALITTDMPSIPLNVIIYKLTVDPLYPLIKQKKCFALEKQKTIKEE